MIKNSSVSFNTFKHLLKQPQLICKDLKFEQLLETLGTTFTVQQGLHPLINRN